MDNGKLLRIKFSGLANISENGLIIDFLPQANINHDEYVFNKNFVKLAENLYYPKVMIMTGANATGKTTILELISYALNLAVGSSITDDYKFISLIKDTLKIELITYYDFTVIKAVYNVFVLKGKLEYELDELYRKKYDERKKKDLYSFEDSKNIIQTISVAGVMKAGDQLGSKVTIKTIFPMLFHYAPAYTSLHHDMLDMYKNDLNKELLELLVKVLDKNIEYFAHNDGRFAVKFAGIDLEEGLSANHLFNKLSDGTKKTVLLFFMISNVLKDGGTFIIDEIENHLNRSIVDLIIDLFQDDRINTKGANILFSTHYAELLDEVDRSDAILITDSKDGKIIANNAYGILKYKNKQRRELKKSKLYISGLLNSKPSYERVNSFKKAMNSFVKD